ncbi:MAG: TNT domain-containing protein [Sporichthyaceae bacterium]
MTPEEVFARVAEAGGDPKRVWVGTPAPDVPPPPEDSWAIVIAGEEFVLGGVERGKFAAYESYPTMDGALERVIAVLTEAPPGRLITEADEPQIKRQGAALAASAAERAVQRGSGTPTPGPAEFAPGDVIDRFGPDTGRFAHPAGTPFPQRSLPPSLIGAPYHRYEVLADLGAGIMEGPVTPWFGQPGGGTQFVFPRPIRWYLDNGLLRELLVGGTKPAGQ